MNAPARILVVDDERSMREFLEIFFGREGYAVTALLPVCVPTMGRSLSNLAGGNKGLGWLLLGIAAHPLQWAGEKLSGRPSALRMILRKPD